MSSHLPNYEAIKADVIRIIRSWEDASAIEGTARVLPLSEIALVVADIHDHEARAEEPKVLPVGSDKPTLPTPASVTLTDEQKDVAVKAWDDTMGELYPERDVVGLLDAVPYDPDEEKAS